MSSLQYSVEMTGAVAVPAATLCNYQIAGQQTAANACGLGKDFAVGVVSEVTVGCPPPDTDGLHASCAGLQDGH